MERSFIRHFFFMFQMWPMWGNTMLALLVAIEGKGKGSGRAELWREGRLTECIVLFHVGPRCVFVFSHVDLNTSSIRGTRLLPPHRPHPLPSRPHSHPSCCRDGGVRPLIPSHSCYSAYKLKHSLTSPRELVRWGGGWGSCQGVLSGRSCPLFFHVNSRWEVVRGVGKLSGGPVRPKLPGRGRYKSWESFCSRWE